MAREEWISDLPEIQYDYINTLDIEEDTNENEEADLENTENEVESDKEYDKSIEIDEGPVSKPKFAISKGGIVLERTFRSYVYNYILIGIMLLFFYMLWNNYSLGLVIPPTSSSETLSFLVIIAFFSTMFYLFKEPVIDKKFRKYIITNNEVIKYEGVFRKTRIVIPYQSVSNIDVYKGVIGRILNFGDMKVVGFKDEITMEGIDNPDLHYRIIQNKISMKSGSKRKHVKEKKSSSKGKVSKKKSGWKEKQKEVSKRLKKRKGNK